MTFRLFRIWWIYTKSMAQISLQSRFGAFFFLLGKFIRFGALMLFLVFLVSKTHSLAGYNLWQVLLFYATFNLIDGIPQFLLRDVYRFRGHVVKGYFDYILAQPQPTLFKVLFGGSDILDLPLIIISVGFVIVAFFNVGSISLVGIILYLILVINALVIATSFHIFVLGMGILTTEVDNTMMLYRDLIRMGQLPVEIYQFPVSFFLTFVLPIGIMISFPVKAALGLLSYQLILPSIVIAIGMLFLSIKFWQFSLKRYTSASS